VNSGVASRFVILWPAVMGLALVPDGWAQNLTSNAADVAKGAVVPKCATVDRLGESWIAQAADPSRDGWKPWRFTF